VPSSRTHEENEQQPDSKLGIDAYEIRHDLASQKPHYSQGIKGTKLVQQKNEICKDKQQTSTIVRLGTI